MKQKHQLRERFETIQKGAEAAMAIVKVMAYIGSTVALVYLNIHLHKALSLHGILSDFLQSR